MRVLREFGFSNRDIEVLVGGRWKEPTIKRYTRGVKVMNTSERDHLLQVLSTLISKNLSIQNVEDTLNTEKLLSAQGLKLELLLNFYSLIMKQKIDVAKMMDLNEKLMTSGKSIDNLLNSKVYLSKLELLGITEEIIRKIINETEKFGDLSTFLKGISIYKDLIEMNLEYRKIHENIRQLKIDSKEIEALNDRQQSEIILYQSYINIAKSLITEHNLDPITLKTLMEIIKKIGEPFQVLDSLNTYGSIEEINETLLNKQTEYKMLEKNLKEKIAELEGFNLFIEEANRHIGEIKANYESSLLLQQLNDLIGKPTEISIEPIEFLKISLLILMGLNLYATSNKTSLPQWESDIKIYVSRAIEEITKYMQ